MGSFTGIEEKLAGTLKTTINPFKVPGNIILPADGGTYADKDAITGQFTFTADFASGVKVLTDLKGFKTGFNIDSLYVGMPITGANIAAGSYITSIDSATQITISENTTNVGADAATTAYPLIEFDFSQYCEGGEKIIITGVEIQSSNGAAATKLTANLLLLDSVVRPTSMVNDAQLDIDAANSLLAIKDIVKGITDIIDLKSTYVVQNKAIQHYAHLQGGATSLYGILQATNAGTWAANEALKIILWGQVL